MCIMTLYVIPSKKMMLAIRYVYNNEQKRDRTVNPKLYFSNSLNDKMLRYKHPNEPPESQVLHIV